MGLARYIRDQLEIMVIRYGSTPVLALGRQCLDASALLALLFDEPGAEETADSIASGACISIVNLSEVATVLVRNGRDPHGVLEPVLRQVESEPFADEDALAAAALRPEVAGHGLSLGDRACLVLAQRLKAPAVTADKAWASLSLAAEVRLVRGAGPGDPSTGG